MKLQLEFEDSDLREMIYNYFDHNGFKVKNLDQLCELFRKAFPDGIKVDAETLGPREATAVTPIVAGPIPSLNEVLPEEEDMPIETPKQTPNRAMSATDLFDPTPGMVPTRDEQLRQSQAEVAAIVARSKSLEEEKAKKD